MLALYFLRMFAITAGYHRYFSHRSYKLARIPQFLLVLFTAILVWMVVMLHELVLLALSGMLLLSTMMFVLWMVQLRTKNAGIIDIGFTAPSRSIPWHTYGARADSIRRTIAAIISFVRSSPWARAGITIIISSKYACRQGLRWWEIDATYYLLKMLSWFGITRDLRAAQETRWDV